MTESVIHVGAGAQVTDSFIAGRDLHVTVIQALSAPPVDGRMVVISAYEDRAFVELEVQGFRALGKDVAWQAPTEPPDAELEPEMRRELLRAVAEAQSVYVFHSVAANRDPFVQAAIAFTSELLAERERVRPGSARGQLIGKSLDGSPLPAALATGCGAPAPLAWVGWILAVSAPAVGLLLGDPIPIGSWALLGLAVALATFVMALQLMRRPDRLLRAARLYTAGAWLDRARVTELLALSEDLLSRIFGARLVSWRSLWVSAAISSLSVIPLGLGWGSFMAQGMGLEFGLAAVVGAVASLLITGPLAVGNVFFDYLSLLVTRSVLRRLVSRPHPVRLWAGLALDGVLVALCAAGTVYTNVAGFLVVGGVLGDPLGWPWVVVLTGIRALSGELYLANAFADLVTAAILVSGVAMITATLPSLVHGALMAVGLGNRLLGLNRFGGRARRCAAGRTTEAVPGPWSLVAPVAVVGLVGAAVWLATPLVEETPTPPDALVAGQWVTVDAAGCGTPCRIGCPEIEEGCDRDEREREIGEPPPPFELLRTEVSQELWESVWHHAAALDPEAVRAAGFDGTAPLPVQLGVPDNPSVHVGHRRPVERVS